MPKVFGVALFIIIIPLFIKLFLYFKQVKKNKSFSSSDKRPDSAAAKDSANEQIGEDVHKQEYLQSLRNDWSAAHKAADAYWDADFEKKSDEEKSYIKRIADCENDAWYAEYKVLKNNWPDDGLWRRLNPLRKPFRNVIIVIWECKELFNPQIQEKLFAAYLQTKGLDASESGSYSEGAFKICTNEFWEATLYSNQKCGQKICLYASAKEPDYEQKRFDELAEIVDEYCKFGYNPGSDVVSKLLEKYTPHHIDSKTEFSGYHDEDDIITVVYNAANEKIIDIREREGCAESAYIYTRLMKYGKDQPFWLDNNTK